MNTDKPLKKLHPNLLRHTAHLLAEVLVTHAPADAKIQLFFRDNKQLGARDRGFIAETVYGCLRQRILLEHLCGQQPASPAMLIATYLLYKEGWSARALEDIGLEMIDDIPVRALVEHIRGIDVSALPLAIRSNLPDWLLQPLLATYGEEETLKLADALNQPATLDVRVNTQKMTREQVAASLAEEGLPAEATPYSPVGLRRSKRSPLFQTKAFKSGWLEVQDEGSQLLSYLLDAQPHLNTVDFCAGAGGKTLHIAALQQNSGSVYAFDISEKRLAKFKPRLKRSGLDNIRPRVIRDENDIYIKRLRGRIDRVLVDAPCSGVGTLRRNPDIKWREIKLDEIVALQQRILAAAAQLLKPGGRLVYATCSLLAQENQDIVNHFLANNPAFQLVPVNRVLQQQQINLTMPTEVFQLFPHVHHTDGFFAAVLERVTVPVT